MMTDNSYKFDERTEEEFISDMEKGLKAEVDAINILRLILRNSVVERPEIVYVGSEKEGTIVYDNDRTVANVDIFPDYLLKYKENRRARFNFIEVKVCNPSSKECYFKVKQLQQYKELGNVVILFVMAYDTPRPKFILVKPEDILSLGIEPTDVYGKKTIKVPTDTFSWLPFNGRFQFGNILKRKYID